MQNMVQINTEDQPIEDYSSLKRYITGRKDVRKRRDNVSLWVFFAVFGGEGRADWPATFVCINLINFFTDCPCLPVNPTSSSFLHLTFTVMAENYFSAITPQFICPCEYEAELAG